MLVRIVISALLVAHGAVHAAYLAPRPPATAGGPAWPFDLDRSWLLAPLGVQAGALRALGLALVAATFGAFALAALAAIGLLPAGLWTSGVVIGSIASLALLGLFFHPWLALGAVIDVMLLWAVVIQSWAPEGVAP